MDPDDVIGGGPALDRQTRPVAVDARGRPLVPSRVPETRPTPLQHVFIYLSIVVLFCGIIAISARELGAKLADPIVRVPVVIGAAVLTLVTLDAMVRIWRSAWAWLPVNRGIGLFRFVWAAVLAGSLVVLAFAVWLVLQG
ncbi:MAG: hypothetical protein ABIZ34_10540 [Candidatus Limnocylindrales bacterium]